MEYRAVTVQEAQVSLTIHGGSSERRRGGEGPLIQTVSGYSEDGVGSTYYGGVYGGPF